LAVRRHERYACALPARLTIAPASTQAVRPSRSVGDTDGAIPATLVDCSLGGLGLRSALFLPVACHIRVTFTIGDAAHAATVRIQRAVMSDRAPTYYLGTALDDSDTAGAVALRAALDALKASGAQPVQEKSGA
jgi:hypothetical protein